MGYGKDKSDSLTKSINNFKFFKSSWAAEPFEFRIRKEEQVFQASKRIYALLVGINQYDSVRGLKGCVNDVSAFEKYLRNINDTEVSIKTLVDNRATKEEIVRSFSTHLVKAREQETILFYFSGYGTREDNGDGELSDCLMCCEGHSSSPGDYLLADIELRYLIGKVFQKTRAHIVLIWDCCFSGDNTIYSNRQMNGKGVTYRDGRAYPARKWSDYIFADKKKEPERRSNFLREFLPTSPQIIMQATRDDEAALEVDGQGAFTKTLLKTLEDTGGNISYRSLMERVSVYMRAVYNQHPTFFSTGDSDIFSHGFLNKTVDSRKLLCELSYNRALGWQLNVGALHGVETETAIVVLDPSWPSKYTNVEIQGIYIDYTLLEISGLNENVTYKAEITGLSFKQFKIELNNYDGSPLEIRNVLDALQKASVYFSFSEANEADFTLHFRSGEAYFTYPGAPYQPVIRPISILQNGYHALIDAFQYISRWHFIRTAENADSKNDPLRIELYRILANGESRQVDISGDNVDLAYEGVSDKWRGSLQIKLTNVAQDSIYVCAAYLSKEFQSFLRFLPDTVYFLEPGKSVFLGIEREDVIELHLGDVEQEYNWISTSETLKFFISREKFKPGALSLDQLPEPLTTADISSNRGYERSTETRGLLTDKTVLFFTNWYTQTLNLTFHNPVYNRFSVGRLQSLLEWNETAYFASRLYLKVGQDQTGQPTHWELKEELAVYQEDKDDLPMFRAKLGNAIETAVRQRRYRNFSKDSSRLRILALGDSWFQYPLHDIDISDQLSTRYAIHSIADPAESLENLLKSGKHEQMLVDDDFESVLVSYGLNELFGDDFSHFLNRDADMTDSTMTRYLTESFFQRLEGLKNSFDKLFLQSLEKRPDLKILVHCYDYFIPLDPRDKNHGMVSWVGKLMLEAGIEPQQQRENLVRYIIDQWAATLQSMASMSMYRDQVHFVDTRNLVARNQWLTELHPNRAGFEMIAGKFVNSITYPTR